VRLFVSATNTNVGKTYITIYLIKKLSSLGYKVGVYKPIETDVEICANNILADDASLLLQEVQKYNPSFQSLSIQDILCYHFSLPASPYVAKKDTIIDIDTIIKKCDYLETKCDILLIEGAGGLKVPINKNFFMLDLIQVLKTKTILVCQSQLGCINDLLLSTEVLDNANIDYIFTINLYKDKDSFYDITYPYLQDTFDEVNILQDNDKNLIEFCIK
jgi:dethiobiotin synthetase